MWLNRDSFWVAFVHKSRGLFCVPFRGGGEGGEGGGVCVCDGQRVLFCGMQMQTEASRGGRGGQIPLPPTKRRAIHV